MYRNLLNWLTILLVLPSCSGTSPTISVVCEENNVGNAIIKWETAPILKGQVKVYASTSILNQLFTFTFIYDIKQLRNLESR